MLNWIIYGSASLSTFVLAWIFCQGMMSTGEKEEGKKLPSFYDWFYPVICFFSDTLGSRIGRKLPDSTRKLRLMVQQSGYTLEAEEVYGAMLFGGISLGLLGVIVRMSLPIGNLALQFPRMGMLMHTLAMATWVIVIAFALAGGYFPFFLVQKQSQKRYNEVMHALPFAIDLMASAMGGGLDFVSSVRYVVSYSRPSLLVNEFGIFLNETELGKSRSDALRSMEQRLGMPEFTRFVSSISFGVDSGVPIQDIMKAQGEELRKTRQAQAEEKAQKAPEKMIFPTVLFLLPATFLVIAAPLVMQLWNSGMLNMLFQFIKRR